MTGRSTNLYWTRLRLRLWAKQTINPSPIQPNSSSPSWSGPSTVHQEQIECDSQDGTTGTMNGVLKGRCSPAWVRLA